MEAAIIGCPVKQVLLEIWAKFFEKKTILKGICVLAEL